MCNILRKRTDCNPHTSRPACVAMLPCFKLTVLSMQPLIQRKEELQCRDATSYQTSNVRYWQSNSLCIFANICGRAYDRGKYKAVVPPDSGSGDMATPFVGATSKGLRSRPSCGTNYFSPFQLHGLHEFEVACSLGASLRPDLCHR